MPASSAVVTPEQVAFYRDNGYVVVNDLLTRDEVGRYRDAVSAGMLTRKSEWSLSPAARAAGVHALNSSERQLVTGHNLWEDFPDVKPLTMHPRVAQAAAALMEVDRLRLFQDQALIKPARGDPTFAHQDLTFLPIGDERMLSAWIPLSFAGSSLDAGAMGYVPGSHKKGALSAPKNVVSGKVHTNAKDPNWAVSSDDAGQNPRPVGDPDMGGNWAMLDDPRLSGLPRPRFVEVPCGGVAFHSGTTVHIASRNRTAEDRVVHTILYIAADARRGSVLSGVPDVPYYLLDFTDRPAGTLGPKIATGQVIDSLITPVVWPVQHPPPRHPPPLSGRLFRKSRGTYPMGELLLRRGGDAGAGGGAARL